MSESPPDSPLPGGGRRIARPSADPAPDETIGAQQPTGNDSTALDGAAPASGSGRRIRRDATPAEIPPPASRPAGGRRRAPVPGESVPDEPPSSSDQAPQPGPNTGSPSTGSWAGGAATAAELSGTQAVGEGYAAARAARRRQTPSARVSVPPAPAVAPRQAPEQVQSPTAEPTQDFSDLRPHSIPRELVEPQPPTITAPEPEPAPVPEPEVVPEPQPQPGAEAAPEPEPAPVPAPIAATTATALAPVPAPAAATAAPARPLVEPEIAEPAEEPSTDDVNLDRAETGLWARVAERLTALLLVLVLAGAVAAGTRIAADQDWMSGAGQTSRIGALVATWAAIALLTRRCGGRVVVIGSFTGALAVVIAAFPEQWALAGAATAGAVAFGLLGMVLTRPQRGVRALAELILSAFIGLVGAVVVSGYDVVLRPYRFRILVLSLVLVAALSLAWRLGHGRRSIGRRGAVVLTFGVIALIASVAYAQAIRSWGSPGLLASIRDFDGWLSATFGASPWPVEALVGFPLLVWGVAFRRRNRQGWWMCAFGALGAGGVTSSLIQTTTLGESLASTGYSVLIGAVIGGVAVALDRMLTGGGGRKSDAADATEADRQEPARFAPLL